MDESQASGGTIQQARQLLASGQPDAAAEMLRAYLEMSANDAEANSLMGAALSMGGKLPESVPYLERAVGLDPQKAPYYFNLGAVVERTGDRERAINCYRRAVELDPNYRKAAESLQRLYRPQAPAAPAPAYAPQPAAQPAGTDLSGNPVYQQTPQYPAAPQPGYAPPPPPGYGQPGQYAPPPAPYGAQYGGPQGQYPAGYMAGEPPRGFKNAPPGVRGVMMLNVLGIVGCVFMLIGAVLMMASGAGNGGAAAGGVVLLLIALIAGAISVLYYWGLSRGFTAVWYLQIVFSGLGLLGGVAGLALHFFGATQGADPAYSAGQLGGNIFTLIIHIAILYYWFQPDTKAWFKIY